MATITPLLRLWRVRIVRPWAAGENARTRIYLTPARSRADAITRVAAIWPGAGKAKGHVVDAHETDEPILFAEYRTPRPKGGPPDGTRG